MSCLVVLSGNILDPSFPKDAIAGLKVGMTVLNGHVLFEDLPATPKVIEFLH